MKQLFWLSGLGALFGGLQGGVVAIFIAAGTGMGGAKAESICFTVNLLLAVGGAFVGMSLAKSTHGQPKVHFSYIVVPLFLGVLCGIGWYFWLDWAISHANSPF